jgi:hypothetical protein
MKQWIKGWLPRRASKPAHQPPPRDQKTGRKEEGWTEAEAEIINQLINMNSLMKIAKHMNEPEHAMLWQINETLCR